MTLLLAAAASSAGAATVGDFDDGLGVWKFGKGSEFPGAQGSADANSDARGGEASLKIAADFSGGGRYVHISRKLSPAVDPGPVTFWVKASNVSYVLVRLVDGSGQTFQPRVSVAKEDGWQQLTLDKLASGQHWGGKNDGKWHGKLQKVSVLLEKQAIRSGAKASLLIDEIAVGEAGALPDSEKAAPAPTAPEPTAATVDPNAISDSFETDTEGWASGLGSEFPGAKGGLERTDGASHDGTHALRLWADFTDGGRYVQAYRKYETPIPAQALSFWVKPQNVNFLLVRVVDSTGQKFQHKLKVEPNDNWQQVRLASFRSRQKWGGADDGQWHGPLAGVAILLERPGITEGGKVGAFLIDEVSFELEDGVEPAAAAPTFPVPVGSFSDSPEGWWPHHHNKADVTFAVDPAEGDSAPGALRVTADLSEGNWLTLLRQLDQPFAVGALQFGVKAQNVRELTVSVVGVAGQRFTRKVVLDTSDKWHQVKLAEIPTSGASVEQNDSRLFGAKVAIRVAIERGQLIEPHQPATLLLDDVVAEVSGKGVLYTPGTAMRVSKSGAVRIATARSIPIYWGEEDTPGSVAVHLFNRTDEPLTAPPVRLLDHALREVALLAPGGEKIKPGASLTRELPLSLPAFGHFSIETTLDQQPVRARVAWVAAEGRPDPDGKLGIHLHLSQGPWGRGQYLGGGDAVVKLVRKIGAGWIREDIRGRFSAQDELLDTPRHGYFGWADPAKAEGLSVVGTYFDFLDNGHAPESDAARAQYGKRFAELVEHYGDAIRVFEVWNEPNIQPGWRGKPDPAAYAAVLASAYEAVKAADADATVVGVTSAGTDFRFIEQVLKAGAGEHMDAISVHPYHGVAPELQNSRAEAPPVWMGSGDYVTFKQRIEIVSDLLARYGAGGKPIWGTEMGSGGKDPALEWRDTCWLIRQHLLGMAMPQLRAQFTYNLQDQGYNEDEASHMTFGILRADGSPEPRLVGLNTLSRMVYGKRFAESLDLGEGIYAYRFAGDESDLLAIWSADEGRTASFSTAAASVTVVDLMGNARKAAPVGGKVTLAATGEPVFVLGAGKVKAAAPLLSAIAPDTATSEDHIAVRIDAAGTLADASASGQAGPGWRVAGEAKGEVTFEPAPDLASGEHTLTVKVGDMSAAAQVLIQNALKLSAQPTTDGTLELAVTNPFPNPRAVQLRPVAPGQSLAAQTMDLGPTETGHATLRPKLRRPDGWTTVRISLNPSLAAGVAGYIELPEQGDRFVAGFTPWHSLTASIDGQFSEWPNSEACVLDQAHQALPVGRFARPTWEGESDLSGRFWVGSDDAAIYLAVAVRDDRHLQPFEPNDMWKGDSVQFAFVDGGKRYEFTIGVNDAGKVTVRQDSPTKRVLTSVTAKAALEDGGYAAELAIPWEAMGLKRGTTPPATFALLINDNDKVNRSSQGGRKGYIEWFGGIGGEKKDPTHYGPVRASN